MARSAIGVTVGIGVDVVDLERFESVMARHEGFVARVFTPDERDYCERARSPRVRGQRYAVRFAAKEAVMKALACGLGSFGFHEVAVARDDDSGEPRLVVTGKAAEIADGRGVTTWSISLTHSDHVAIAFVVAD